MAELHKKPTREELKANADAALKKLEGMPEDPPADPEPPTDQLSDPPEDPQPPIDPPQDPPADPEPPTDQLSDPPEDEPKPGDPNWEERYKGSSREAQKLALKDKEVRKAIEQGASLPIPTEEELKAAYPDWDDRDDIQKRDATDNLLNKQRFDLIREANNKVKALDNWEDKVKTWTTDPKTLIDIPDLEGKTDAFIAYASTKKRINNDLPTLVTAFLAENSRNRGTKKGQMFPTAGGGGAAPIKVDDGKISAIEGRVLMKTDYNKFKELLKAGKIRNE